MQLAMQYHCFLVNTGKVNPKAVNGILYFGVQDRTEALKYTVDHSLSLQLSLLSLKGPLGLGQCSSFLFFS